MPPCTQATRRFACGGSRCSRGALTKDFDSADPARLLPWDREHSLYWKDQALEVLKKSCEEHNIAAVKELLKAVAGVRPVGRPPKSEVERHIAIEARIAKEYQADIDRLSDPNHLRLVKDH